MIDSKNLENLNKERDMYEPILARIESCCGKHGVIRNVEKKDEQLISRAITYFYGSKGQWWKKNANKTMDVEFVPMTKVYPPPKRPWEWCGKTILFQDWQFEEETNKNISKRFKIGQRVSFTGKYTKGQTITGIIAGINKRAKVIVPGQEIWWYIPYTDLTKI